MDGLDSLLAGAFAYYSIVLSLKTPGKHIEQIRAGLALKKVHQLHRLFGILGRTGYGQVCCGMSKTHAPIVNNAVRVKTDAAIIEKSMRSYWWPAIKIVSAVTIVNEVIPPLAAA